MGGTILEVAAGVLLVVVVLVLLSADVVLEPHGMAIPPPPPPPLVSTSMAGDEDPAEEAPSGTSRDLWSFKGLPLGPNALGAHMSPRRIHLSI